MVSRANTGMEKERIFESEWLYCDKASDTIQAARTSEEKGRYEKRKTTYRNDTPHLAQLLLQILIQIAKLRSAPHGTVALFSQTQAHNTNPAQ